MWRKEIEEVQGLIVPYCAQNEEKMQIQGQIK